MTELEQEIEKLAKDLDLASQKLVTITRMLADKEARTQDLETTVVSQRRHIEWLEGLRA